MPSAVFPATRPAAVTGLDARVDLDESGDGALREVRGDVDSHDLAGVQAIQAKRQYVPPSLAVWALDEVRLELGYDLEPYTGTPPPALVKHFSVTLQSVAERTAARWAVSALGLADYFH